MDNKEIDLIPAKEAAEILETTPGFLAWYHKMGRVKIRVKKEGRSANNMIRELVYYSHQEILALKENKKEYEEMKKSLMSWDEVIKLTGYSRSAITRYTKDLAFPVEKTMNGKRPAYFFDRKKVLNWMKKYEGEVDPNKRLINSAQATQFTGYSWPTLRKYISNGELTYELYNPTNAPGPKAKSPLNTLGQGYWFQIEELIRFREWLGNKLKERNCWAQPRSPDDIPVYPHQTSDPIPPPTKRTPRVSKEVAIELDLSKLESGERAIAILKGLESRIHALISNGTRLKAQDIYQLVQSCKAIKGEWRNLKKQHPKSDIDAQLSKEILSSLEARINILSTAGTALGPLEIYYLTMAEAFVQAELKIMAKTEVEGSGLSADDYLLERLSIDDSR